MSTKPKPQATEHSDTFEKLPEKTKDLMKLKEQEEKSIGLEQIVVTSKIEDEGMDE